MPLSTPHLECTPGSLLVRDATDRGVLSVGWFDWHSPETSVKPFVKFLRERGIKKAIGFAQSRGKVELLGHMLNTGYLQNRVFVHHAGISQSARWETERMLRNAPGALVVATTKLEVGVDVGSLDICFLFDAPLDKAAFLQRAGWAGWRSGQRQVICVSGLYNRRAEFARVMPGTKRAA